MKRLNDISLTIIRRFQIRNVLRTDSEDPDEVTYQGELWQQHPKSKKWYNISRVAHKAKTLKEWKEKVIAEYYVGGLSYRSTP